MRILVDTNILLDAMIGRCQGRNIFDPFGRLKVTQ